jgi:hypothetical protein
MAARQKTSKSNSGVKQTSYDEAAVKARAAESTRAAATSNPNRSASATKATAPTRTQNPVAASSRSGSANDTTAGSAEANTKSNRKPGLIAPPAR